MDFQILKRISNWIVQIGSHKDGITVAIAIVLLLVGGFQYFDSRIDARIEQALQMLQRREAPTFVKARTIMLSKWLNSEKLCPEFSATDEYSWNLNVKIKDEILEDESYRDSLVDISNFYSNAAACTIHKICDTPLMCASLMGQVQDFLNLNRDYFVHIGMQRQNDSKTLTLHMPEFVEYCSSKLFINVASQGDRTSKCRWGVYLYRLTNMNFNFGLSCEFKNTKYDQIIDEQIRMLTSFGLSACLNSPNNPNGE